MSDKEKILEILQILNLMLNNFESDNWNEDTYQWSQGYRKAIIEIIAMIEEI